MHPAESLPITSTYSAEFAAEAHKLALARAPNEALARHFDIPLATLHEWREAVPEFARAAHYGRKMADAHVVDDAVDVLSLFGRMLDQMSPATVNKTPGPRGHTGPGGWMG